MLDEREREREREREKERERENVERETKTIVKHVYVGRTVAILRYQSIPNQCFEGSFEFQILYIKHLAIQR